MTSAGPLAGVKVIELGGIGPGPHAGMVLADLGADVVRVRRPGGVAIASAAKPGEEGRHQTGVAIASAAKPGEEGRHRAGVTMLSEDRDLLHRGKRIVDLDIKTQSAALLELAAKADVLLDCFRPGTCERLGIGPDDCAAINPRLIFARITGWGQDGPLASTAGHDINYLSQTGALSALGYRDRPPMPPLNLVADFGGGSMLVLLGIVVALYERERSGKGQIVDAAMVDGVSVLAQMMWTMKSTGALRDERESFLLDGGAPFYRCYETADGKYMAVGAIEPQFFAALLTGLGLSAEEVPSQLDIASYQQMHEIFAQRFASQTQDQWTQVFAGTDACVTPVLTWSEAASNDHLRARSTVITCHGVDQAAPAPRFSRTPAGPVGPPPAATTSITEIGW
ncbi:putative fatty-acid-CoA racemase FAR [Mycobacterium haemophilum DSM 44634]|uniref:CaiB/BaiF CoA transferase family protein n=1 Tax=Mycobacterium haemophilum TaxID=29311 RepID=UPI0006D5C180|nr:CaiB/BaiF CoA-transferase family protein [Mycobacterium haemophilum]MCV7339865.1 CoA transferase [Mycobacterium haemophilum DSM 44634]